MQHAWVALSKMLLQCTHRLLMVSAAACSVFVVFMVAKANLTPPLNVQNSAQSRVVCRFVQEANVCTSQYTVVDQQAAFIYLMTMIFKSCASWQLLVFHYQQMNHHGKPCCSHHPACRTSAIGNIAIAKHTHTASTISQYKLLKQGPYVFLKNVLDLAQLI